MNVQDFLIGKINSESGEIHEIESKEEKKIKKIKLWSTGKIV